VNAITHPTGDPLLGRAADRADTWDVQLTE
jgi:hypothetical protein